MGTEFLFGMIKVLNMYSGDDCITLGMCLIPLN